jgi:hypothetical protein
MFKETDFALRTKGFECSLDSEERLFACFDRAAEISPHLNESQP